MCTHRYAFRLFKYTSTKHRKYVVNQNIEHIDDISFIEPFGRIRVFVCKVRVFPSQNQVFAFTLAILSYEPSLTYSLSLSFSFERGIGVQRKGETRLLQGLRFMLRFLSELRFSDPIKPLVSFHECFIFCAIGCLDNMYIIKNSYTHNKFKQ